MWFYESCTSGKSAHNLLSLLAQSDFGTFFTQQTIHRISYGAFAPTKTIILSCLLPDAAVSCAMESHGSRFKADTFDRDVIL